MRSSLPPTAMSRAMPSTTGTAWSGWPRQRDKTDFARDIGALETRPFNYFYNFIVLILVNSLAILLYIYKNFWWKAFYFPNHYGKIMSQDNNVCVLDYILFIILFLIWLASGVPFETVYYSILIFILFFLDIIALHFLFSICNVFHFKLNIKLVILISTIITFIILHTINYVSAELRYYIFLLIAAYTFILIRNQFSRLIEWVKWVLILKIANWINESILFALAPFFSSLGNFHLAAAAFLNAILEYHIIMNPSLEFQPFGRYDLNDLRLLGNNTYDTILFMILSPIISILVICVGTLAKRAICSTIGIQNRLDISRKRIIEIGIIEILLMGIDDCIILIKFALLGTYPFSKWLKSSYLVVNGLISIDNSFNPSEKAIIMLISPVILVVFALFITKFYKVDIDSNIEHEMRNIVDYSLGFTISAICIGVIWIIFQSDYLDDLFYRASFIALLLLTSFLLFKIIINKIGRKYTKLILDINEYINKYIYINISIRPTGVKPMYNAGREFEFNVEFGVKRMNNRVLFVVDSSSSMLDWHDKNRILTRPIIKKILGMLNLGETKDKAGIIQVGSEYIEGEFSTEKFTDNGESILNKLDKVIDKNKTRSANYTIALKKAESVIEQDSKLKGEDVRYSVVFITDAYAKYNNQTELKTSLKACLNHPDDFNFINKNWTDFYIILIENQDEYIKKEMKSMAGYVGGELINIGIDADIDSGLGNCLKYVQTEFEIKVKLPPSLEYIEREDDPKPESKDGNLIWGPEKLKTKKSLKFYAKAKENLPKAPELTTALIFNQRKIFESSSHLFESTITNEDLMEITFRQKIEK